MPGDNVPGLDELEIEIDMSVLVQKLLQNHAFVDALTIAVRDNLLRDARSKGTLFRQWGGTK